MELQAFVIHHSKDVSRCVEDNDLIADGSLAFVLNSDKAIEWQGTLCFAYAFSKAPVQVEDFVSRINVLQLRSEITK